MQVTLTDEQYERLRAESRRSGLALSELVRRALDQAYGFKTAADLKQALEVSFGSWRDRDFDGASYVEGIRRGMAHRLADR